ncbi:sushi domain-containing protein 2-like isoform X2 [Lytechinus variegatus]|uniref:sushi domain-containing protein 2-like isoform X2 n=1 Tax=Lytechinus variegatus TaxID=7654 RepID=UPI001BB161A5|nr:sushi domain-containing protein 2-like isoform X2 [Lytechinus variegatus]
MNRYQLATFFFLATISAVIKQSDGNTCTTDTDPPVVTCQNVSTLPVFPNSFFSLTPGSTYTYTDANYDPSGVSYDVPTGVSGYLYLPGDTAVTLIARDLCNNVETCVFYVTNPLTELPVNCPDLDSDVLVSPGQQSYTFTQYILPGDITKTVGGYRYYGGGIQVHLTAGGIEAGGTLSLGTHDVVAVISDDVLNKTCTGVLSIRGVFFPFGSDEGDDFLPANDDGFTDELPIAVVFPFFDHDHTSLFVNNNGVISFLISVSQYTPDPFPLADGRRLLTPFWGDVDTTNGGTLSYREVLRFTQDEGIFIEADDIIRSSFVEMRDFVSSWMYIATWDRVAFFGASDTSIRNSFQAVLVTDGRYSFAIFNYGDINWTTGTASGGNSSTGLGGIPAQVGFNAGDGVTHYNVPASRTADVVDIETTSNIGVPGRWVFRTDNSNIQGQECTTSGDISLFPLVGSMLGATQVLISGPCFNSTVVCDFDGIVTSGRLLTEKIALCVSPTFYKVGRIPLRVSLNDGDSFDFSGIFTIISVEDVPDNVYSSVTESNQRESDFGVIWNTDVFESVDEVDIVVYGYREDHGGVQFAGPLVTLAQGVEYDLGNHIISVLQNTEIEFDVGVIGVIESEGQNGNSANGRAAIWSEVHVLWWLNGDELFSCLRWTAAEILAGLFFQSVTPSCPCTLDQARVDVGRFSPDPLCDISVWSPSNCISKPGAIHCVRADMPSAMGGGQECCYDHGGMIINVFNSLGGGYSHRYHHGGVAPYEEPGKVPYLSHYLADILPWRYCCASGVLHDPACFLYGLLRRSQTCNGYQPPPPALGNGDPHISTTDSTTYTFNGYGEFTMMTALNGTFILQARTAPLEGVSVTGRNITSDGIVVTFDQGVGLTMKASEGAMSILLVAPESFQGQTQGLMGTWNGNSSDDFLTPNGTLLSPDSTTEELHYQFGMLWEIDSAESLFYYEPGKDHESHTDRGYIPVFEPVANPSVNQSLVEEVCGTNRVCIFDFQTTGSQSFAQNSVASLSQYEQAVHNRAVFVGCPSLPDPLNGSAIVTAYIPGGVARFVCNEGFELSHEVNLTCQSNGSWSDGEIPTCDEMLASTQTEVMTTDVTKEHVTGTVHSSPKLTVTADVTLEMTTKEYSPTDGAPIGPSLSRFAIIGISVGSVVLIVVVVVTVSLICKPKRPTSRKVITAPRPKQVEVHRNPAFIQTSMEL